MDQFFSTVMHSTLLHISTSYLRRNAIFFSLFPSSGMVIELNNIAADLPPFLTTVNHKNALDEICFQFIIIFQKSKQLTIESVLLCLIFIMERSKSRVCLRIFSWGFGLGPLCLWFKLFCLCHPRNLCDISTKFSFFFRITDRQKHASAVVVSQLTTTTLIWCQKDTRPTLQPYPKNIRFIVYCLGS